MTPVREEGRGAIGVLASAGILALVATRMLSAFEPFPYFSGDPLIAPAAIRGITPALSAWMDVITILLGGTVLLGEWRAGRPASVLATILTFLGAAAAMHFVARGEGDRVGHIRLGLNWLAAWVGALALAHEARDARVRTLAVVVLLGVTVPLAGKGAFQYFVEHAETVAQYLANREAFLAEQGWSVGSPNQLAYERRIMQNEATGWFALSNPYATVVGSGFAGLAALALAGIVRSRQGEQTFTSGWVGVLVLGAVSGAGALALSASKGGILATALGLAIAGIMGLSRRAPNAAKVVHRLAPHVALAGAVLIIGGVVMRGVLGEKLGELSLLFRWFYMVGSARMIGESPLLGVGPAGFQQAYMLLKPPLSPEDAASAHSLFFDLGARLGLLGLAWGVVAAAYSRGIGRALAPHADQVAPKSNGPRLSLALACCALAVPACASAWVDARAITPDAALVRLLSFVLWIALAAAVIRLAHESETACRVALACAAIVAFLHAQIEVTPVLEGSACWFAALLGVAWQPGAGRPAPAIIARLTRSPLVALATAALALPALIFGLLPIQRWETHISRAGENLGTVGQITSELRDIERSGPLVDPQRQARVLAQLQAHVGPPAPGETLDLALSRLVLSQVSLALPDLQAASGALGGHAATLQRASRVAAAGAFAAWELGEHDEALRRAEQSLELATRAIQIPSPGASSFAWRPTLRESLIQVFPELADSDQDLSDLSSALSLDPYNSRISYEVFAALRRSGASSAEVREAARRALTVNELSRLDPLRQLSDERRRAAESALSSPDP